MVDLSPSERKRYGIDMTPLIDVVFLLLIFFMLTFAIQGQGIKLRLPQGESAPQEKVEKDLIVKIDQKNNLHLNGEPIQISLLKIALDKGLINRSDKLVVIDAAPRVKYGLFARVLDISRDAGAENFSIIK